MATKKQPQLGNTVRCVVTGLTGIAYQTTELATGTIQYSVQPKLAGKEPIAGAIPDAISIDVQLLEYIDDGIAERVIQPEVTPIKLGAEVEDVATGIVGMTTSKVTFVNGCVYFNVQPKQTKKQKEEGVIPDIQFISSNRLKQIGAGFSKHVEKNLDTPPEKRTGGPMTRARRAI